ncbi:MAG: hypothetical protein ACE5FU_04425 [Nitrospinota bacterium]
MGKISNLRLVSRWMWLLGATAIITDPGPKITADIDIRVSTGDIFNSALGSSSKAHVEIGSILSGKIDGVIKIVVKTRDIVNSAEGNDSSSMVRVGTIGR